MVGEYWLIHQFVLSSLYPFSFIEGKFPVIYTTILLGPPFHLISLIFCYANINVLWKPLDLYTILYNLFSDFRHLGRIGKIREMMIDDIWSRHLEVDMGKLVKHPNIRLVLNSQRWFFHIILVACKIYWFLLSDIAF